MSLTLEEESIVTINGDYLRDIKMSENKPNKGSNEQIE